MAYKLRNTFYSTFSNSFLLTLWLKVRMPVALLLAIILLVLAQPRWFPIAVGVSIFGEAIQLWCFGVLIKNKELTVRGPYALSRNPMYIGRYFLLLGFLLLPGRLWLVPVYTTLYFIYMLNRAHQEELVLSCRFRDAYHRYRSQVRRFIPQFHAYQGNPVWCFSWRQCRRNSGGRNLLGMLTFYVLIACRLFLLDNTHF